MLSKISIMAQFLQQEASVRGWLLRHGQEVECGGTAAILLQRDGSLLWASDSYLRMHGADSLAALQAYNGEWYNHLFRVRRDGEWNMEVDTFRLGWRRFGEPLALLLVDPLYFGDGNYLLALARDVTPPGAGFYLL